MKNSGDGSGNFYVGTCPCNRFNQSFQLTHKVFQFHPTFTRDLYNLSLVRQVILTSTASTSRHSPQVQSHSTLRKRRQRL